MIACIASHVPFDYELQICPHCTHWVSRRQGICHFCYAEFSSNVEIIPKSTWHERVRK